jgi:hypothetical protein
MAAIEDAPVQGWKKFVYFHEWEIRSEHIFSDFVNAACLTSIYFPSSRWYKKRSHIFERPMEEY